MLVLMTLNIAQYTNTLKLEWRNKTKKKQQHHHRQQQQKLLIQIIHVWSNFLIHLRCHCIEFHHVIVQSNPNHLNGDHYVILYISYNSHVLCAPHFLVTLYQKNFTLLRLNILPAGDVVPQQFIRCHVSHTLIIQFAHYL